jgi:hypothetical protein
MAEVDAGAVAPVEPVVDAPAANAVPAPDAPAGQDPATPPEGEQPVQSPKTFSEEEMRKAVSDRLTKERKRLERIVRAEMERDFYKQQLESRDKPAPAQPKGEPKPENFENPVDFVRALYKWEREQEKAQESQERERETVKQRDERLQIERAHYVQDKILGPGQAKFKDFAEVVMGDDVPITEVMVMAAGRLKAGIDVLYHLGRNPDEAHRISQLPDIEQAWEVKALEGRLTAKPAPTRTPAPIVPNGASSPASKDWKDMSTEEHVKAWAKRPNR